MNKLLSLSLSCLAALHATAAPSLELVAKNFKRPVALEAAPSDDQHLYIVEQHGVITAIDRKSGERKGIVLDIIDRVSRKGNEEGLLGLAFSPNFAKDHRFYVNYTDRSEKNAMTHISRFTIDPASNKADPSKEERLLSFKQDFRNHNGGWIGFGPDGFLYIGVGDGGAANDPKRRAQDLTNHLGSILRINVDGSGGYQVPPTNPFIGKEGALPEIYCYGIRNPWRCSFDRKTGALWIADVGQNHWEEVNFAPKGTARGANYGWRLREGFNQTPKKTVGGESPTGAVEPIYEYKHGSKPTQGLSITGGYVYYGSNKELQGQYLFADYVTRGLWGLKQKNGKKTEFHDHTKTLKPADRPLGPIASFGEDNQGEVYIIDHTGPIYRIK